MSCLKPTITIAIPSYNKEKYIDYCLKSILVEKDFVTKIILVDNCSTDKTFELAKKYEPFITCYRNLTNLGMAGNWNRCIDLCETDWLMIFHADDELLPGSISDYLKFIESFPSVALIHADSYFVMGDDENTKKLTQKNQKSFWKAGLDALKCEYGVCSAVMVKKDVYNKLGSFIDKSLSSDAEMWARIAGKYDVGYINEPTVVYRISNNSTGPNSLTRRSLKEIKADWDYLNERIALAYPDQESRDAYLLNSYKLAPSSYWVIVKENVKVHNYIKALQACKLIIFEYHGFFPLIKLSLTVVKKMISKKLRLQPKTK